MALRGLIDFTRPSLGKIFREYEELAIQYIWQEHGKGVMSREVWSYVNDKLGKQRSISRASILMFLHNMVEMGVLNVEKEPGKGGYHEIFTPLMTEKEFRRHIILRICKNFIQNFPDEFKEVLNEFHTREFDNFNFT